MGTKYGKNSKKIADKIQSIGIDSNIDKISEYNKFIKSNNFDLMIINIFIIVKLR